jgi:hypothetical protein
MQVIIIFHHFGLVTIHRITMLMFFVLLGITAGYGENGDH